MRRGTLSGPLTPAPQLQTNCRGSVELGPPFVPLHGSRSANSWRSPGPATTHAWQHSSGLCRLTQVCPLEHSLLRHLV